MDNELSKRIELVNNMRLSLVHNGVISFDNIMKHLQDLLVNKQYIQDISYIKGYTQIIIQTNNPNTIRDFINVLFSNLLRNYNERYDKNFDYSTICTTEKYSDNIYIIRI